MEKSEIVGKLIGYLLDAQPEYKEQAGQFPKDDENQRYLLRCLMNTWYPYKPLPSAFFELQDQLLKEEAEEKHPVSADELQESGKPHLYLWQGDITRLKVDAIVNAANSQMLGCFVPGHSCIDNAIHSAAGLELRVACYRLMQVQGHEEETGKAKITGGYNLPAKHVIHTVGPIVQWHVTKEDRNLLASCYRSCLELAEENKLHSIAFCCISTGVFHYPHEDAAETAVRTVQQYLGEHPDTTIEKVIFNVFKEEDKAIYERLLG